jgi:hypothetical protein
MNTAKLVKLFFLAIIFASGSAAAQSWAAQSWNTHLVLGKAYERKSGAFLYNEQHFCNEQQLLCTVEYSDAAGEVFAKKLLDFRQSSVGPSLVMNDYRNQKEISIPASQSDILVIDAGFDNFVRRSWDELSDGQQISFPFLPAGFDKPLNMKALRSEKVECEAEQLCLDIKLDSWLLAMIVAPIELSYSRSNKRLLHFSGMSNIRDEEGETQNVDIHYEYLEEVLTLDPVWKATASAFYF